MQWLKQSTAVTVLIGPFLDESDGKTAETALTIAQADVRLSKNGGNLAQKNDANAATHDELGIYDCALDATDTNTLGRLQLFVHESGALPVWHDFMVVPENVWDSFFGSDMLEVDVRAIDDDETAADNAEAALDGTGYGFAGCTMPTVTTLTGHTAQTGDTYARLGAPAGASIAADVATVDALVDAIKAVTDNLPDSGALTSLATAAALATVDGLVDAIKAVTDNLPDSGALTSLATAAALATVDGLVDAIKAVTDALNDPTADAIADQVWDEAKSGHTAAGSFGDEVQAHALSSEVAGLNDPAASAIADAVWDEPLSGHGTAGTAAKYLTNTYTLGAGAITFTYTLTSTADGSGIVDADVWVTSDETGNNKVASGQTDGNGQVTFYLDAGTYYFWREKAGYNFTNPDTETVS